MTKTRPRNGVPGLVVCNDDISSSSSSLPATTSEEHLETSRDDDGDCRHCHHHHHHHHQHHRHDHHRHHCRRQKDERPNIVQHRRISIPGDEDEGRRSSPSKQTDKNDFNKNTNNVINNDNDDNDDGISSSRDDPLSEQRLTSDSRRSPLNLSDHVTSSRSDQSEFETRPQSVNTTLRQQQQRQQRQHQQLQLHLHPSRSRLLATTTTAEATAVTTVSVTSLCRRKRSPTIKPLVFVGVLLMATLSIVSWFHGLPTIRTALFPPMPDSLFRPSSSSSLSFWRSTEGKGHAGYAREQFLMSGRVPANSSNDIVHVTRLHSRNRRKRSHSFSKPPQQPLPSATSTTDDTDDSSDTRRPRSLSFRIEAFGKTIVMDLEKLEGFYLHRLPVLRVSNNETWYRRHLQSYLDDDDGRGDYDDYGDDDVVNHCFHSGHVRGDPGSKVVVSLCSHMSGIIEMFDKRYVIEPLTTATGATTASTTTATTTPRQSPQEVKHVIYEMEAASFDDLNGEGQPLLPTSPSSRSSSSSSSSSSSQYHHHHQQQHHQRQTIATVTESHGDEETGSASSDEVGSEYGGRVKRSTSVERNVELMLAVDHEMEEFYGGKLEEYLLTLISIVSSIYSDKTVGNYINIVLVKIIILNEELSSAMITSNPRTTLTNFSRWQRSVNVLENGRAEHWDTAVLLSRVDFCSNSQNCDILGLAELGAMCDPTRSSSIAEDSGLSSAFTIAHELGHVLGIAHDDADCLARHSDHFTIMARTMDQRGKSWCWSDCSRLRLSNFLDAGKGDCLNNVPTTFKSYRHKFDEGGVLVPPGSIYSADQQCAFVFGLTYVRCPYAPSCAMLWCRKSNVTKDCESVHMQWADGTPCNGDKDYSCQNGKCTKRAPMKRRDGQWSEWQPYGECSRTCGGGVQKSVRLCNNPEPENGGSYCLGRRAKYRSCNHKDCPEDVEDFREVQCKKYNGNHFNISGLDHNVTWVAKISDINPEERCKLYCQVEHKEAYYRLKERVEDGTKCGPDTSDICIFGQCKQAGCDNKLGSTLTYDRCGVCGGDNKECRLVSGSFTRTSGLFYGYNQVVSIPRGATYVDIRQRSHTQDDQDNTYLALMDPSGQFLLNGYFSVCYYKKEVKLPNGGGMLQYSGAHGTEERINTTAALKTDLFVYVLMVGDNQKPPDINWEYTVRMHGAVDYEYQWNRMDWTPCNRMCQGTSTREAECIHKGTGFAVHDHLCHQLGNKPDDLTETCNMDCEIRWNASETTECIGECGRMGYKILEIQCVKEEKMDAPRLTRVSDENCDSPRPQQLAECFKDCSFSRWKYTEWDECSSSCGSGVQRRLAECIDDFGATLSFLACKEDKESLLRECNTQPCPEWVVGVWSGCSVTCGEGREVRSVTCSGSENPHTGQYVESTCDMKTRPSSEKPCYAEACPIKYPPRPMSDQSNVSQEYDWTTTEWSECSRSCDHGIQTRRARCRDWQGMDADDGYCHHIVKPYQEQPCNFGPCPLWVHNEWSRCSATCGLGQRRRGVFCRDVLSTVADRCDPRERPHSVEECYSGPCPPEDKTSNESHDNNEPDESPDIRNPPRTTTISNDIIPVFNRPVVNRLTTDDNKWVIEGWSKCSTTCGEGKRKRHVTCRSPRGELLEEIFCDPTSKPRAIEECMERYCGEWRTGDWTTCSRSCDGGVQMRHVACKDWTDGDLEAGVHCNSSVRPPHEQTCNAQPCPAWAVGDWNHCSKSCDGGIQTRQVSCLDQFGRETDENQCTPSPKPTHEQPCNSEPCPLWVQGDWSHCSQSCNGGIQLRRVVCMNWLGQDTDEGHCTQDARPHRDQPCNTHPCPLWTYGEWGQCSQPCNGGMQARYVACKDWTGRDSDEGQCDPSTRPVHEQPCNLDHCPVWVHGEWNQCSATCGWGVKHRFVACYWPWKHPPEAPGEMCHGPRPSSEEGCQMSPCPVPKPRWVKKPWSQCSVSCGKGWKTREVLCVDKSTGVAVADAACRGKKPEGVTQCHKGECNRWNVSSWGQCSKSCEGGKQKRLVTCTDKTTGTEVHRRLCRHLEKPNDTRHCNGNVRCHSITWRTGNWTPCSRSCGRGVKVRNVRCTEFTTGSAKDDSWCVNVAPKPKERSECFVRHCPYTWLTSDWTQCSRTCGGGIEKRTLSCRAVSMDGRMLPNSRNMSLCDATLRPAVERPCNLGGCHDGFRWMTGPWSSCSKTCGTGQMNRHISCINSKSRTRVDGIFCRGAIKPDVTKPCFREQCYPTSCEDLRDNAMVRADGDYIIMVRGIMVYLYCHGMATSKPKEFISLLSDDNFSEVYDKRLVRLNTCPNNGSRLESSTCSNCFQAKLNFQAGHTRFEKIRLNVTSLQVMLNDFTFATRTGFKGVPYGTAGDCYSKSLTCPQGSFAIDLSGTMFTVSQAERWVPYGSHVHVGVRRYNPQVVRGKCGGYCGGCRPSKERTLQLQIYH